MVDDGLTLERFLLDTLWQSTLWLTLGLVASTVLNRRPSRAHAALLLCLAAAAATPVAGAVFRLLGWGLFEPLIALIGGTGPAPTLAESDTSGVKSALLSWPLAAVAAWLALSVFIAARLLISVRRARRLLATAEPVDDEPVLAAAAVAAARTGLTRGPRILAAESLTCPAIWCWGHRPRLLLPADGSGDAGGDDELVGVLCHEFAHLQRRDHLATITAELVVCLLPWNPLSWVAARRLRGLSEEACDAWVLAGGESPTAYAETLLGLIPQPQPALALAAVNCRRGLARRIVHILSRQPTSPHTGLRWATAAVLVTTLLVTTAALAHRRPMAFVDTNGPSAAVPDVVAFPRHLDLETGEPGKAKTGRVWLVNRGRTAHRVRGVSTTCGCTTVNDFEPTVLRPDQRTSFEISMTAPTTPGAQKTKTVIFQIDGQPPLKLAVHLQAAPGDT